MTKKHYLWKSVQLEPGVRVMYGYRPPIAEKLKAAVGLDDEDVITYDGIIYAPAWSEPLPPDVIAHEKVHLRQQREYPDGVDTYVNRYLMDPKFRQEQELEAYREQLRFIDSTGPDRNERAGAVDYMARMFSTTLSLPVSLEEARRLITS